MTISYDYHNKDSMLRVNMAGECVQNDNLSRNWLQYAAHDAYLYHIAAG